MPPFPIWVVAHHDPSMSAAIAAGFLIFFGILILSLAWKVLCFIGRIVSWCLTTYMEHRILKRDKYFYENGLDFKGEEK
jgi:hypothetical protein